MTQRKITPLLILLPLLILFLAGSGLYFLFVDNKGGQGLAGIIMVLYSLGVCAILFAERVIVEQVKISVKNIWAIELILIIIVFLALFTNIF